MKSWQSLRQYLSAKANFQWLGTTWEFFVISALPKANGKKENDCCFIFTTLTSLQNRSSK